ncbi:hypothetical protein SDC9_54719 [bioreactor metagenome]|uniref:Uncharacterized protein n=1 Tax=bioreactor metagenome TaxID=1076179 RepID=A0A644WXI0_9ZZZZ
MEQLRYDGHDIFMQEVPGEISLILNITECPHRCVGCHSSHLAESYGEYVGVQLPSLLGKYHSLISCVCFMGGDQHIGDLVAQCQHIRDNYPELKIAVYTGADDIGALELCLDLLDYVKIGHYDEQLGGIDRPSTNQRMYKKENGKWSDITAHFWKNHNEI